MRRGTDAERGKGSGGVGHIAVIIAAGAVFMVY